MGLIFLCLSPPPPLAGDLPGVATLSPALRDALLCVSPMVPDLQRDVVAQAAACGWCVPAPTFFCSERGFGQRGAERAPAQPRHFSQHRE